jgi:tRNA-dihydrouridine synthase A
MDWSDRHCRYFWRLMSRHARLYTEMVTTGALIHGDRNRFLQFHNAEHPIALQLGGSEPKDLAECSRIATDYGYDEINLNCGCPSDRVQEGRIGACLMAEPNTVADCVSAMRAATALPVTVKHRIGVDDLDSEEHLHHFVSTVAAAGCTVFIVHARKAWLQGLSPKQNREIPPLDYGAVERLKQTFPQLTIVINGGITNLPQSRTLLENVDGVMLGREAYHNPYILATVDQDLFGSTLPIYSRDEVFNEFLDYCKDQLQRGVKLNHMTRHLMGLYAGQPGGRLFRRYLSDHATRPGAGIDVLIKAQAQLVDIPVDGDNLRSTMKYSS